jgi:ankyrin repeat protein
MTLDNGTQFQGPPVMGESDIDELNPLTPAWGSATDTPGGSENHNDRGSPVSVFDILDEMVGDEDDNTDALRNILVNDRSIVETKRQDGLMVLHVAATKGLLKAVKVLLEFHASISAQDDWGRQPLYLACLHGKTDIAGLLVDEGAAIEVRWEGHTPLDIACWSGHIDVVKLLIEKDAEVLVADNNGCSPLYIASALRYEKIAKLLLEKDKSNIDHTEKEYGRTALHAVTLLGCESIASMLIDEGAGVNLQDSEGCTALHMAIVGNHPELVNRLLNKGARTDIQDDDEWTALHFVARFSDKEIATKVLSKGARDVINVKDKHGWIALHVASRQGNEVVVKALLGDEMIRSRLEINAKDNDDNTALHLASGALGGSADKFKPYKYFESESEEKVIRQGAIIEALLGAGADSTMKNKKSKTSIDLIMADDEPYRFRGLLGYVSHPYLSSKSPTKDLDPKKRQLNGLLAREEFFTLLTRLVDQNAPGIAIKTTLRSTLYMILDVLGDDDNRPLLKHFPFTLGLLISTSSPNDHLNSRLKSAAVSIANISKRLRAQNSQGKPQKAQQTNITTFNGQNKGKLQDKGEEIDKTGYRIPEANSSRKVPEALLRNLDDIGDILRDPQFSQLHKDDYSTFIRPKADKCLEGVLEGFEAAVVQFYKERGESGSLLRYRSVHEVIYGAGPTTIMEARSHYTNFKLKQAPRFSWVHLPSTNVSVLSRETTVANRP